MTTFFGIEARDAQGFIDRHTVCLPHSADGKTDLRYVVSPFRKEDIVFIKHCTSPSDLHIRAIGVVASDYWTSTSYTIWSTWSLFRQLLQLRDRGAPGNSKDLKNYIRAVRGANEKGRDHEQIPKAVAYDLVLRVSHRLVSEV